MQLEAPKAGAGLGLGLELCDVGCLEGLRCMRARLSSVAFLSIFRIAARSSSCRLSLFGSALRAATSLRHSSLSDSGSICLSALCMTTRFQGEFQLERLRELEKVHNTDASGSNITDPEFQDVTTATHTAGALCPTGCRFGQPAALSSPSLCPSRARRGATCCGTRRAQSGRRRAAP